VREKRRKYKKHYEDQELTKLLSLLKRHRIRPKKRLGQTFLFKQFIAEEIGDTTEEWKYYGKKLGWTLKKFYKKRNLFFIGMYKGYFKIAFVFGERAVKNVLDSSIAAELKKELSEARKYAEGRGISINVDNDNYLDDVKELIRIKVRN